MLDQNIIDRLRGEAIPAQNHLVDGKSAPASDGGTLDVVSPIDGSVLTTLARGTAADMEAAVASARAAFEDGRWSRLAPAVRKAVMLKWADLIEAEAPTLTVLGVRDNGTEIGMAFKAEAMSAVATIRYYAEALDKIYGEIAPTAPSHLGLIHKEPVGVVGAIVPWNFPLMIGTWKLGPALAAGNSVVLKPAETASLTLIRIAELALEAGVPPGVLNVVTGEGAVVGEAMGLSMDVNVLVFTGSGRTGRRLLEYAARSNLKRVYLELGGKSPNIVFADAPDLDIAAKVAANAIFRNAGQVCVAASRLLVEAPIHDDFVAAVAREAEALRVGDPLLLTTEIGAVHSQTQLDQDLACVEQAVSDGGELVLGGKRRLEETGGFYMGPTIITGVTRDAGLNQNEVFGPVLAVSTFGDEAEATSLANSTEYGLSAGVWTSDLGRAHRMIRAVRSGIVHVNCYGGSDLTVPLGGHKQSGNGHDKSLHALDKYVDLKTGWIQI